jgi:hypothetical protein
MLGLAVAGAGVSQVSAGLGWLYWTGLVVVYAAIGILRAWGQAKREGRPRWPMVRAQALHWLGALVTIKIIFFFEAAEIADRGTASDYALLVLALSTFLAGVHFDWPLMLLGAILAVIAIALGELDQLSVFAIVLPLAALAIWLVSRRKPDPKS